MKGISPKLILLLLVTYITIASLPAFAQSTLTDKGWPRKLVNGANSILVYQPQIEQWQGNRLEARAAVAVTEGQSKQTAYGVVWFTARTEIDKLKRLVRLADFRITKVSFPGAGDRADLYQRLMQQQVPQAGEVIALDRLLADMTEQAEEQKEALIANDVPQTATITRNEAKLQVNYDGPPQFKPIEGTTLAYAVNTPAQVIAVSADSYYAVENGVWFVATSASGPWVVAASVPSVIYTIPPSAPVHNVTYVKVYGSTPQVVYVGYTPGYWRTYTNIYTGTTVTGGGGVAYNPNTGRISAGQAGVASNAYTGNAAAGARGVSYNPVTGVISGGAAGATYNAATGQTTAGAGGFAYNTRTGNGATVGNSKVVGNNNVYAGKDGNVYRYNQTTGAQQHTGSGWQAVNRPADVQNLQNQQRARAAGEHRWENFRSSGGSKLGSGGPRFGRRR